MVAHEGHGMAMDMTMDSSMDMGGMSGMAGMATAFFTSTSTPLYSDTWAPANVGQYAGTCIFLIVLAIILRAVFTLKALLDAKAIEAALKRRYVVVAGEKALVDKIADDAHSMTGILTTNGVQEDVRIVSSPVKHIQPFRFSVDLPRALLMTTATGIGYLL
jgi:copper transporter 1